MDDHDYRERLTRDVGRWRRDDVISDAQAREMLARAGAGSPSLVRALRMGWLVSAVSIVGALVLGAGVVLLFAANWQEMPDSLRTAIVLAALLASYAAGYVLTYKLDLQRMGSAMLLLGVLLYQASLFLLAQIYNMPVDSPVLFLLGALGGLPLAYLFGSRIVLFLSLAAVVAWQIGATSLRYDNNDSQEWIVLISAGIFGLMLYAAGRLHFATAAFRRLGDVYLLGGALVTLAVIYAATFDQTWEQIIDNDRVQSYSAPGSVYILIVLAALAVGAQLVFRWRTIEDAVDVGAQAALVALAAVVATWPAWDGYTLVFNAAFFAIAAGIVARGYAQGDERYINFGLAAVGLGLATRYVDTFWSLLAGSAFFIGGGALLLGLAFVIERFRRELLRTMRDDDDGPPDPIPAEALA
ncbi:MAG TPA: DUF2157 domain-containing protein [Dehalococcoidia bacterium]